jgi:hypothetical protein
VQGFAQNKMMDLACEHSVESGGQGMNNDINRYQAKTIADVLLFMVMATGLFAMVVYGPAARSNKRDIVLKHNINNYFPFDIKSHYEENFIRQLTSTGITNN